jgi:hypothetical protein
MALNEILSSQGINCAYTNTTNADQELKFSIRRQENILPSNPSNYDCYVSRWYLDSNAIPSFRITADNQSDYYAGIIFKTSFDTFGTVVNFPIIDLYSEKEFIDLINQAVEQSYQYFSGNTNLMAIKTTESVYSESGIIFLGYSSSLSYIQSYYEFTPTSTSGYTNTCNYIRVSFTFSDTLNSSFTYYDNVFEIYLKNMDSGKQVLLTNNLKTSYNQTVFCDWGQYNQEDLPVNASATLPDGSTNYNGKTVKPSKMFSIFKGDKLSGAWRLIIVPMNNQSNTFNYALLIRNFKFYAGQNLSTMSAFPTYAPYLSVDTSSNLQINYTDSWKKSTLSLFVSPKIYSMMGFNASYLTLGASKSIRTDSLSATTVSSLGGYSIPLPVGSYSTSSPQTSWKIYTQPSSTFETFCDIEAILLTTTMNIELEQDILSPIGGNKVLMSFIVDKYSATNYQFNMTGDNRIRFRLTQTQDLTSFEMQFMIKRKNQTPASSLYMMQYNELIPILSNALNVVADNLIPTVDGLKDIGSNSFRYQNVYLSGAVITTSDANHKTNVQDLAVDVSVKLINKLEPKVYNLIGKENVTRYGLIAQTIEKTMYDLGLDGIVHKSVDSAGTRI